jgi:hypothetical protein
MFAKPNPGSSIPKKPSRSRLAQTSSPIPSASSAEELGMSGPSGHNSAGSLAPTISAALPNEQKVAFSVPITSTASPATGNAYVSTSSAPAGMFARASSQSYGVAALSESPPAEMDPGPSSFPFGTPSPPSYPPTRQSTLSPKSSVASLLGPLQGTVYDNVPSVTMQSQLLTGRSQSPSGAKPSQREYTHSISQPHNLNLPQGQRDQNQRRPSRRFTTFDPYSFFPISAAAGATRPGKLSPLSHANATSGAVIRPIQSVPALRARPNYPSTPTRPHDVVSRSPYIPPTSTVMAIPGSVLRSSPVPPLSMASSLPNTSLSPAPLPSAPNSNISPDPGPTNLPHSNSQPFYRVPGSDFAVVDEIRSVPFQNSTPLSSYTAASEAPPSPEPVPIRLEEGVLVSTISDLECQSTIAVYDSKADRDLAYNGLTFKIPNQVYLYMMLRLPAFYFGRVSKVFEDAELNMKHIRHMAVASQSQLKRSEWDDQTLPRPLQTFKATWHEFIESVVTEWKTLNLISALLLS